MSLGPGPRRAARRGALLLAVLALLGPPAGRAAAQDQARDLTIGYLQIADDARYQPQRAYTGLRLKDRKRPLDGALRAIRESRSIGRALKIDFALAQAEVAAAGDLSAEIGRMRRDHGVHLFVLDAPAAALKAAAAGLRGQDVLLFNVTEPADALRGADCEPALLHVIPSRAMLTDALVQYLLVKNWPRILVLKGPLPEDELLVAALAGSAGKFGARIVATKDFVLGQDPRHRDQNNVALLTSTPEHDVVFVADAQGEFGRYVPYQTSKPRPVVGTEGLSASAWHWTWERHGAPQLNQRFEKQAGRTMQDIDWAAWAAVKAIVEAAARTNSTEFAALGAYLRGPEFRLDAYKGTPASFRPTNNQLRQPILLHTHNAVVERAPLAGFLHPSETLDTLGLDGAKSGCRF